MIAAGLVKRPNTTVSNDEEAGWMSVWGLTDNDSANGYLGTGIIMPIPSYRKTLETSDHYLMISTVPSGEWFTYYAGAGWSRSGDFKSSEDWNDYLSRFTQRLSHPLRVVVSTHR
jgi:unsaturated rhamnogalacturonyl hydrolase